MMHRQALRYIFFTNDRKSAKYQTGMGLQLCTTRHYTTIPGKIGEHPRGTYGEHVQMAVNPK